MENPDDKETLLCHQIDCSLSEVPGDAACFHAQFRRSNPLPAKADHVILDQLKEVLFMPEHSTMANDLHHPIRKRSRIFLYLKILLSGVAVLTLLITAGMFLFPRVVQSAFSAGMAALLPHYLAWRSDTGPFVSGRPARTEARVPMRDGVGLATDLYLPVGKGPFPVILVRTPYTKAEGNPVADFFGRYGYAVVIQDVRGRHASEGEFYPFSSEVNDGVDLVRWVKAQSWCNGKIGAFGGSYLGYTQWAMNVANPDLTSIAPALITADPYRGIYRAGAFGKLTFLHWSLTSYGRYGDMGGARNIEKGYSHFPLAESDDAALKDIAFYNEWVAHPIPDDYWRTLGVGHRFGQMTAPALMIAGWYDFFLDSQLEDFQLLRKAVNSSVASQTKLLIGPWNHGFFNGNQGRYGIKQRTFELIPFEFVHEIKSWYDYSLKGIANGWERRAPVRLYVLGRNGWRDESEWPPARSSDRSIFLHSAGKARTVFGDGSLDTQSPSGTEPEDVFTFDPNNAVPTRGGAHGLPLDCGPADQQEIEKRADVLVYSSRPLEKPLMVVGRVKLRLYASSSAPDTDFTAKLVDVFPDGRALIVCEGVIRARYRNGLDKAELLEPGRTYPFDIMVGNTAVEFQKSHRVRIEISSSNFPRYDPNPNTGGRIDTERNPVAASQKVFHSREYASALILPVVPEE